MVTQSPRATASANPSSLPDKSSMAWLTCVMYWRLAVCCSVAWLVFCATQPASSAVAISAPQAEAVRRMVVLLPINSNSLQVVARRKTARRALRFADRRIMPRASGDVGCGARPSANRYANHRIRRAPHAVPHGPGWFPIRPSRHPRNPRPRQDRRLRAASTFAALRAAFAAFVSTALGFAAGSARAALSAAFRAALARVSPASCRPAAHPDPHLGHLRLLRRLLGFVVAGRVGKPDPMWYSASR